MQKQFESTDISTLKAFVKEYPYCQTTRLLLLRQLYLNQESNYSLELKKTAAYATDRAVLYYLTIRPQLIDTIEKFEEEVQEESTTELEKSIEPNTPIKDKDLAQLEQQILSQAISASISLEAIPENIDKTTQSEDAEILDEENIKSTGISKQSFSEWLNNPKANTNVTKRKAISNIEMIDRFIQNDPVIVPKAAFFSPSNIAKLSLVENEDFVTETLADIYEKQGNYEKAISAFQKLSLKNPEKSSYFADRISNLKKLL